MYSFINTLRGLGPMKLGTLVAVAAGLLAFFIYLTSRIATPELALLYGQLEAEDSGEIIKRLDELKVPYEISQDGSKILVSGDEVARVRVIMAQEGLPNGGSIGYEIFDRSDGIGTTNFVQNINHVRALEGELSRTIRSIGGVKMSLKRQLRLFGRDETRRYYQCQAEAIELVRSLGQEEGIDFQAQGDGEVTVAATPSHYRELVEQFTITLPE